jgi:hypothetical protein
MPLAGCNRTRGVTSARNEKSTENESYAACRIVRARVRRASAPARVAGALARTVAEAAGEGVLSKP